MTVIFALEHILFALLELWDPRDQIECVPLRHPADALAERKRRQARLFT